jgi:hypothetical protein
MDSTTPPPEGPVGAGALAVWADAGFSFGGLGPLKCYFNGRASSGNLDHPDILGYPNISVLIHTYPYKSGSQGYLLRISKRVQTDIFLDIQADIHLLILAYPSAAQHIHVHIQSYPLRYPLLYPGISNWLSSCLSVPIQPDIHLHIPTYPTRSPLLYPSISIWLSVPIQQSIWSCHDS